MPQTSLKNILTSGTKKVPAKIYQIFASLHSTNSINLDCCDVDGDCSSGAGGGVCD